jgi:sugar lactone lactonase YvrE
MMNNILPSKGIKMLRQGVLMLALWLGVLLCVQAQMLITTIAGDGTDGFSGDGGLATSAQLNHPYNIAVDSNDDLYISDILNHRIRKIDATTGIITTIAGNGTPEYGDDGSPATSALYRPAGIAVDSSGNVYFSEVSGHRIRKIVDGIITTIAGTGTEGFSGDGGPATSAQLDNPLGMTIDNDGNLYFADNLNGRIRKINLLTGIITTVAGNGNWGSYSEGDGGPATSAKLSSPVDVALDSIGNLYIAQTSGYLRMVDTVTNIITTIGGSNKDTFYDSEGVAIDSVNNLYVVNRDKVFKVVNSTATTIAGTGTRGYNGDNIPATDAQLNGPRSIVFDSTGTLYIADRDNHRIRKVFSVPNSAPTVTGSGIADVLVNEEAADTVINLWAAFEDAEDTDNALTYTVDVNTNTGLFDSVTIDASTGELTLDYAADANSTADITIKVTDTGGLSVTDTFTVTVNAVNDAPSFTAGSNQSHVGGTSGTQTVIAWATAINKGAADENSQTLTFNITIDNDPDDVLSGVPGIDPNTGNLSYNLTGNSGTVQLTITLQDNGGTAFGGADTSAPVTTTISVAVQEFTLTVTKGGTGNGTVSSIPNGIDCGDDCTEDYIIDTMVELTAIPNAGSRFIAWSGHEDCDDGTVTMDEAKTCTAIFDEKLLIELSDFGITETSDGIFLEWTTAAEYDTAGFHLWEAQPLTGNCEDLEFTGIVRLTDELRYTEEDNFSGAYYNYDVPDGDVENCYGLEEVYFEGEDRKSTFYIIGPDLDGWIELSY